MTHSTAPAGIRAHGRLLAVMLASTALLSACNLGPRYVRPDIPAPAAWTPVTAESTPSAAMPAEESGWPDAQWWHGFGSPELDRLIQQAQVANDDLKAAVARVQQADAQVRIAGAALLPSLQAGFTPARSRAIVTSVPNASVTTNTFTAYLNAGYELD